ncbi:MAG: glutamate racemase [Bacteroidetes bacterium]|nr:glutamate racemase [Bacteroidota bacterium]
MNSQAPIGIFDSGVGGTSIWQEIHELMPHEHTLYLADSKYAPYGDKSQEEIIALSKKNTEFLIHQGCKLIVIACNTATTNAISQLRATYNIPFIGIEPAIKPAALQTQTKSVGILATQGTLSSELFHQTADLYTNSITLTEVVGKGLVPLIEKGALESPEMTQLLQKYIQPMLDANIDRLVLGCSHYPYLIPLLKQLLPNSVTIIDSGEAVALQTKTVLTELGLLSSAEIRPTLQFFTNAETTTLALLLRSYLEKIIIEKRTF